MMPIALTLAEINREKWSRVAVRVRGQIVGIDAWRWDLPEGDIDPLKDAREAGRLVTAQQRQPDRAMWLLARAA